MRFKIYTKIQSNIKYLIISIIGTTFDMRSCATESFLTDPPTEEIRNIVNKGQRDFSVNIIKSLFNKYQRGNIYSINTLSNRYFLKYKILHNLMKL